MKKGTYVDYTETMRACLKGYTGTALKLLRFGGPFPPTTFVLNPKSLNPESAKNNP